MSDAPTELEQPAPPTPPAQDPESLPAASRRGGSGRALFVLLLLPVLAAGGYWAYWHFYARFQPTVITRNQAGSIDLGVPRTVWGGVKLRLGRQSLSR